jgi:hypothetical protein
MRVRQDDILTGVAGLLILAFWAAVVVRVLI